MASKQVRQAKIRELLRGEPIATHEQLAAVLRHHDIAASQSTLSKDLRELGVVRLPGVDGGFRYALPEAATTLRDRLILERELCDYLTGVDRAGSLLVVRTLSGHAQSVCEAIDRMGWPESLGTIAGDNTIFVATRGVEEAEQLARRVGSVVGEE